MTRRLVDWLEAASEVKVVKCSLFVCLSCLFVFFVCFCLFCLFVCLLLVCFCCCCCLFGSMVCCLVSWLFVSSFFCLFVFVLEFVVLL